jgi:hypothetical protein
MDGFGPLEDGTAKGDAGLYRESLTEQNVIFREESGRGVAEVTPAGISRFSHSSEILIFREKHTFPAFPIPPMQ